MLLSSSICPCSYIYISIGHYQSGSAECLYFPIYTVVCLHCGTFFGLYALDIGYCLCQLAAAGASQHSANSIPEKYPRTENDKNFIPPR